MTSLLRRNTAMANRGLSLFDRQNKGNSDMVSASGYCPAGLYVSIIVLCEPLNTMG